MVGVGARTVLGGGWRAWKPWLMPSAETVGSKERVSFSLVLCWRKANKCAMSAVRRREDVTEDVMTRPRLRVSSVAKNDRSAESSELRGGVLKALRLRESDKAQLKAMIVDVVDAASRRKTAGFDMRSQ